ncbi:hypothetical protein F5146DRAFT_1133743 [Armillaria mellea]|nr:hypothetical protein F5146DRAFT_1133743 [Armillaria mellea]
MASLDGVDVNLFDDGSHDDDLPIPLVPHSFNDNNPPTHPSSPLTRTVSDNTSVQNTSPDKGTTKVKTTPKKKKSDPKDSFGPDHSDHDIVPPLPS